MSGVDVVTFGCRLNAYESDAMARLAREAGLADTVIVNTCAVTAEAERQARQAIRKLRRARPGAAILVTGCAAEIAPQKWSDMAEVTRVIANGEKLKAAAYAHHPRASGEPALDAGGVTPSGAAPGARLRGHDGNEEADAYGEQKPHLNDPHSLRETGGHLVGGFEGRARAYLQVQNGCDHRCTFCIIPYGRGPSRSVPLGPIVAELRALVEAGFREVVLTGVDVTSYGHDLPGRPSLGAMLTRLLAAVPDLPRLRLTSLDPAEIDDALWRLIAEEPRLAPHLHLSVQAGDDMILKRMKRRHSRADVLAVVERARRLRPGIAIGADLIAGFPTETDAMAENTARLVAETGLPYLHVFPYSAREGTPAARMPQLPMALRRERAARLRALGAANLARFLAAQIGRDATALVEQPGQGRTEHYAPIRLPCDAPPGALVPARVAAATAETLVAAGAA